jgi:hypothetical protein
VEGGVTVRPPDRQLHDTQLPDGRATDRRATDRPDRAILARIQEAAPEPPAPFGWLARSANDTSVFVPLMLGAGIVFSALAWAVERVARVTTRPAAEQSLARRLDSLAVPAGGLLDGDGDDRDLFSPLG